MENRYSQQLTSAFHLFIREEIALIITEKSIDDTYTDNQQSQFLIPFGWRRITIKLKAFYDELFSRRLIISSQEEFEALFKGDPVPIRWYGTLRELAYILNCLMDLQIINNSKKLHKLLASNFIDSNGEPLNVGSLKSTLKRIRHGKTDSDLDLILATCM